MNQRPQTMPVALRVLHDSAALGRKVDLVSGGVAGKMGDEGVRELVGTDGEHGIQIPCPGKMASVSECAAG